MTSAAATLPLTRPSFPFRYRLRPAAGHVRSGRASYRLGPSAGARRRPIGGPRRARIREEQQRRADCPYPCGWAARGVGGRVDNALLLWPAARIQLARMKRSTLCAAGRFGGRRSAPAEEQSRDFSRPEEGSCPSFARCRRPPSLARHAAGVPPRPSAAQQGDALPGRPADDRGDRDGDAPRRRPRARPAAARPDRRALASRRARVLSMAPTARQSATPAAAHLIEPSAPHDTRPAQRDRMDDWNASTPAPAVTTPGTHHHPRTLTAA